MAPSAAPAWSNRERPPAAEMPDEFICPITRETMRDPVIASDGFSYEREAIERWLSEHDTSPMTNQLMEHLLVVSNHNLRRLLDAKTLAAS